MVLIPASQPTAWSAIDAGVLEDQDLITGLQEIVTAENTLAGLKLRVLAEIDTRTLAKQLGSKTTGDWLGGTGTTNPGTAKRLVRTAVGLAALPAVADAVRGGDISVEHAAAIVTAIAQIDRVAPELDAAVRAAAVDTLLAVARVHAPHLVAEKGRDLLLRLHPRETDTPAEDTTRNCLELSRTRSGRTRLVGDLDALTGEKLRTALSPLAKPAPAADGTPDDRTPGQRHADALATLLDLFLGSGAGPTEGGVKPHLLLTTKLRDLTTPKGKEAPDPARFCESAPFRLEWGGGISQELALLLACDCTITAIVLDDHEVPLKLGRTQRLVPPSLRRALIARDQGCVRCGAPAAWSQAHHLQHWSEGGATDLGNLALLCGRCHRELHRGYWDLVIGPDGHPWIVPPKRIDEHRKPVPGYFRRTQQQEAA